MEVEEDPEEDSDMDIHENEEDEIMPPKTLKQKAVKRMVQKRVAEAIAEYEKNMINLDNAGGSVPTNTEGVNAPKVHECTYKTFLNCHPHKFNGTEGVVGLKRWFEKMEQVFEIRKCADEDKRYIRGLPERVKANVTSSKPASLHDSINMACELIEQAIQAKATRIGESYKRKWEDHQRNNNNNRNSNTHRQQQNKRQEDVKAYIATLAE
ncbi:hypothetical protein Tco_0818066 [Tanacetum coccineum]